MLSDYLNKAQFEPTVEDILLAEVAVRLQLTPTAYRNAQSRYEAISNFLDENRNLPGGIDVIHPQGSMAIGATVAARGDDEFDIDLVAELDSDSNWSRLSPAKILDAFYAAFNEDGKYKKLLGPDARKTRCITLSYADNMHLDVTPLQLRDDFGHGNVMHHRNEEKKSDPVGEKVPSTPRRFAEWFEEQMPVELAFGDFYESRSLAYEQLMLEAKAAEVEPVSDQEPAFRKPRAKVCLQLLKRFRNLRYIKREERMPPSILLSKLIADNAAGGTDTHGLFDEMRRLTECIIKRFEKAEKKDLIIKELNPKDDQEKLTDRWPLVLSAQKIFITDLKYLLDRLENLSSQSLADKKKTLAELFGEKPAGDAIKHIEQIIEEKSRTGTHSFLSGGSGGLVFGEHDNAFTPRKKDFYGS